MLQVTLKCLHQMFDSAKDIMQWLSLCARVVAKADKPVHWTTPLGLPVVQPYRKKVCPALPCPAQPCHALILKAPYAYPSLTQHNPVSALHCYPAVMLPQQ